MATFLNGVQVGWWSTQDNYIYATLTGSVTRSGNTVTLSDMVLTLTSRYSSWGQEAQWFIVNGTQTDYTVYANGLDLGSYQLNNTSFSVSDTQTSASVSWASFDGWNGSFTVGFPSGSTPPTGLTVSAPYNITPHGATFDVSISSYGNPPSTDGRWIEAGIAGQNAWQSPSLRSAITQNTLSASITVDNTSTQTQTLAIKPNTQYYYGGGANNLQMSTSTISGQFVTAAEGPQVSISSKTTTSVTLDYVAPADGGYYNKTLAYSIDNGSTWTTFATITSGSAASGSFTISGLTQNSVYTVLTKVTTTVGSTAGTTVTADLRPEATLYGSVSGQTQKIVDLYCSSNGQANLVTKIYGSVNGEAKLIYQGFGHST